MTEPIFIDGDFNDSYESRVRASKGLNRLFKNGEDLKCPHCGAHNQHVIIKPNDANFYCLRCKKSMT